jgi:hypothetical protein
MVTVQLGLAIICFAQSCFSALIGQNTPIGEFQIEHKETSAFGYGGDILLFKETDNSVFAIHRVINFNIEQRRLERLQSDSNLDRKITDGCINVMPDVYEELVKCCNSDTLIIKE